MQEQAGMSRESKLRALAKELGLDAVIAMSPENFAYASNVHVITVNLLRPRQAFAIIPAIVGVRPSFTDG